MSFENTPELYLISRLEAAGAWSLCRSRLAAGAVVRVVLLHDAVLETEAGLRGYLGLGSAEDLPVAVVACAADARRRGVGERWALAGYPEIVQLCVDSHPVISW